ncbi:NXPE family member 1-like isoform X2 [Lissotriton helveticus]
MHMVHCMQSGRRKVNGVMFLFCAKRKLVVLLALLTAHLFLISFSIHRGLFKFPLYRLFSPETSTSTNKTEAEQEIKELFYRLDQRIPHVTFTHMNYTTSAQRSKANIQNPKHVYCIGDNITVQIDMYDHLGKRKTYGGDLLRVRIFSPGLNAGASGKIEDLNNGTYLIHFTLFWAGKVYLSLQLYHPSEGVSALWRARNQGFENVYFLGTFTGRPEDIETECGFSMDTKKQLCKYEDSRDLENFYCVKPHNVSCAAFAYMRSNNRNHSYLSSLEKDLFDRSNVAVEIGKSLKSVIVWSCNNTTPTSKEACQSRMRPGVPSGFFYQDVWHPLLCKMSRFKGAEVTHCLQERTIHLMGDSTLRQWIYYFPKLVKTLKFFNLHGIGIHQKKMAVDIDRNLQIIWSRHGHPYVTYYMYRVKGEAYLPRQIDGISGGPYTIVVITLGQHFRLFPIEVFLRRVVNIRKAIERLHIRSPTTKVIIKSENTRELHPDIERFSDFHGYVQYLAVNEIFQDLNVAIIDAWDMTTALATDNAHPPENIIANQIDMFLTFICQDRSLTE